MDGEPVYRFRHENPELLEYYLLSLSNEQLSGVIESCYRQMSKINIEMEMAQEILQSRYERWQDERGV